MQAILTKYLPATNYKGARIKASCDRGSLTVSYPYELSGADCHIFAAEKLVEKFVNQDKQRYGGERNPWSKPRLCGQLPNGDHAHVFAEI